MRERPTNIAESRCTICGEKIGYEARYYLEHGATVEKGPWTHADCADAAEPAKTRWWPAEWYPSHWPKG